MTEAFWPARIEIPGTARRGAGFLVTDRHVMTCAHVVRGHDGARVTLRDGTSAMATVVRAGPWWTETAAGADVAVLELPAAVAVPPARLAPYAALEIYAGQTLDIFGFPDQYGVGGVHTNYVAEPHHLVGDDIQIEAEGATGVRLQEGFSGAAVVHRATRQVVGMVRRAATGDERIGLMTPVASLAGHCPALADRIRLGLIDPAAYGELRAALRSVDFPRERFTQLLTWVRGKIPSLREDLTSVPGLVEALVVDTVAVDDREMRYHLSGLLSTFENEDVSRWAGRHLGRVEAPAAKPVRDGAVVICLEPTAREGGEAYRLKVWTVTEADGLLEEPVADVPGLSRDQWQPAVERELAAAIDRIPRSVREVTVEFVLPRMFLAEPVDEWLNLRDDRTPLGISKPLVVRDLDWFQDGPPDLAWRAESLREGKTGLAEVLRVWDCGQPLTKPVVFKANLRKNGGPHAVCLAGEWALPAQVSVAVGAQPPVLLWRRHPCPPGRHADYAECVSQRFVRELTGHLAGVTIDDVASHVLELRRDSVAGEDETHCGSGLVLLRDDARRRPMPLGFAG
ncbi:trypsin-like peptidase domain-containing protein [Actinoplanes sp. NPDC049596]|uniref:VMAP-C domain-containing protein n=1 Tax=unclassified Actinoplanes TaxID=2626549 RepID=UPI00344125C3